MTNYEKYKDQIDWQARAGVKLAVRNRDNTPTICEEINCKKCISDVKGGEERDNQYLDGGLNERSI